MRSICRFNPLLLLAGLVTSDDTEPAKKAKEDEGQTFRVELTPQKPDARLVSAASAASSPITSAPPIAGV